MDFFYFDKKTSIWHHDFSILFRTLEFSSFTHAFNQQYASCLSGSNSFIKVIGKQAGRQAGRQSNCLYSTFTCSANKQLTSCYCGVVIVASDKAFPAAAVRSSTFHWIFSKCKNKIRLFKQTQFPVRSFVCAHYASLLSLITCMPV